MKIRDLTFIEDEQRRVQVADNMALVYDGKASGGVHWRWDHLCTVYEDLLDGLTQKRIASYLSRGHHIISKDPLTIEGSLLCLSCKLHGHVRNGKWSDA